MNFEEITHKIQEYSKLGKRLFSTSSFQTHSIPLLHIISRIDNSIPVYFINTGYHFPETVEFKDHVAAEFGITVLDLKPLVPKSMQLNEEGKLLFTSDPNHCCYLNKTQPVENLLRSHDVWINGVRADQNAFRQSLKIEQEASFGCIRFHPMLSWTSREIHEYRKEYSLPSHPLDAKGYASIGCEPCTRKIENGTDERDSRWFGLTKTECGLHTDLIKR